MEEKKENSHWSPHVWRRRKPFGHSDPCCHKPLLPESSVVVVVVMYTTLMVVYVASTHAHPTAWVCAYLLFPPKWDKASQYLLYTSHPYEHAYHPPHVYQSHGHTHPLPLVMFPNLWVYIPAVRHLRTSHQKVLSAALHLWCPNNMVVRARRPHHRSQSFHHDIPQHMSEYVCAPLHPCGPMHYAPKKPSLLHSVSMSMLHLIIVNAYLC